MIGNTGWHVSSLCMVMRLWWLLSTACPEKYGTTICVYALYPICTFYDISHYRWLFPVMFINIKKNIVIVYPIQVLNNHLGMVLFKSIAQIGIDKISVTSNITIVPRFYPSLPIINTMYLLLPMVFPLIVCWFDGFPIKMIITARYTTASIAVAAVPMVIASRDVNDRHSFRGHICRIVFLHKGHYGMSVDKCCPCHKKKLNNQNMTILFM